MYPRVTGIPDITRDEMIEIDRLMVEDFGIQLIQMMENAGHTLAQLVRTRFLEGEPRSRSVLVLAGSGGNGGGALVCARHLQNWGAQVSVVISSPEERLSVATALQLSILRQMRVMVEQPVIPPDAPLPDAIDVIIDGLDRLRAC